MTKLEIEITIKADEKLLALLNKLVEAAWDLAEVAAPLTGHRIVRRTVDDGEIATGGGTRQYG